MTTSEILQAQFQNMLKQWESDKKLQTILEDIRAIRERFEQLTQINFDLTDQFIDIPQAHIMETEELIKKWAEKHEELSKI